MIRPSEKTLSHRHSASTIYHVFRGKGATLIGSERFEWEEGDSFVVPLWALSPPRKQPRSAGGPVRHER